MPIYPFERMVFPKRVASPFLSKPAKGASPVKGPGGIEEGAESANGEKGEGVGAGAGGAVLAGGARKRPKRSTAATGPSTGATSASEGGTNTRGAHAGVAGTSNAAYTPHQVTQTAPITEIPHRAQVNINNRDRSVVNAARGMVTVGNPAMVEKLPPETGEFSVAVIHEFRSVTNAFTIIAKHFDRDPDTNEVLWFSSPPMNMVQSVKPKHSLAYLHFLATKRKRAVGDLEGDDRMEVDGDDQQPKQAVLGVRPTMSETVRSMLVDLAKEDESNH